MCLCQGEGMTMLVVDAALDLTARHGTPSVQLPDHAVQNPQVMDLSACEPSASDHTRYPLLIALGHLTIAVGKHLALPFLLAALGACRVGTASGHVRGDG
jgi:hypothetical protein